MKRHGMALKRYLWLVHLVLIAIGVYIGADLFWAIMEARLEVNSRAPNSSPSATAETPEKRPFQQYAIIQERNLFGARGRAAAPPPPRPATPPPPPAKAAPNLKLVGTVIGSAEHTYAVIEDLGAKRQELYRLGDLIREVKVVEITRNRVVLDNRGKRQELLSFEKTDPQAPASEPVTRFQAPQQRQPPPQEPREPEQAQEPVQESDDTEVEIERVNESAWRINRDDLVEQLDNLGQLMTDARLTPHFKAGQADGFMITNLPRNSLLGRLGLRNGDIMKGVNGQNFGSLEEVLQIYQQLQSEPMLQLEIERGNRTETLTYEIR
jgi:general secretion pathway protein C